ncbi:MAG: SPOR domain-containing protein [Azoarcus sp.]|nr:SPOR domain-containing protein [Azoarcus sp.]
MKARAAPAPAPAAAATAPPPQPSTFTSPTPLPQDAPVGPLDDDPLRALIESSLTFDPPAAAPANIAPDVTNARNGQAGNGQNLFLQLGVFASRVNAGAFRDRVEALVDDLAGKLELAEDEEGRYRLFVGPYDSLDTAHAAAERIGGLVGIRPFAVRRVTP